MTDNSNRLSRFWQELKRRKVIYVITVYASASFVLIELINNVSEPLNLPQGLSTIAIVVLAIGFPFAVVLSWIFDVTPKGFEKTKPSSEVPEEVRAATPNSWRIATYASVVVIIGLISYNLFTRTSLSENLSLYGKSIAVLPFINDSQNEEDEVFINGTMESILNKISSIKDIRVMQRESVEPFRAELASVTEVIEKLRISYVLKGSMRRYGKTWVINVQLIDQNDYTIWSRQIDKEIHEIDELFILESQIAQEVAQAIKATITPEELHRIEKVPTKDPMAYQLCLMAESDFMEWIQTYNDEYLWSAKKLYQQALSYDSTYATAIAGLGWVYLYANIWEGPTGDGYLDSVKIYIDRSLSYDGENFNTHLLQGHYYFYLRDWTAAERSYNKSLELNPNFPVAYVYLGNIFFQIHGDYVRAIKYYEEAEKRNRSELRTADFYRMLGHACMGTGFFDMAEDYLHKAFVFDGDTFNYNNVLGNLANQKGDYKKAAELEAWAYSKTKYLYFIGLWNLIFSNQIEEANKWAKYAEENEPGWELVPRGYLASISGEKEKAEQLFNMFMEEFKKGAKLGPDWVVRGSGHLSVAMIYAFRGQKGSSYIYLDELLDMKNSLPPSDIRHLEINPIFDQLREEERFQKILRRMQSGYQDAHERMRLYLEETGRL